MESNPNNAMKSIVSHLTLAGAAALCSTAAQAQVVFTNVDKTLGYAPGDLSSLNLALPGNFGINLADVSSSVHLVHAYGSFLVFKAITTFAGNNFIAPANAGQVFNTIGSVTSNSCHIGVSTTGGFVSPTFTDKYFAFAFLDHITSTNGTGWIKATLTDPSGNLSLYVDSYAYLEGAYLPMGDGAPAPSVPEPTPAIVLAAFGALALGAVGVKRLKALQN